MGCLRPDLKKTHLFGIILTSKSFIFSWTGWQILKDFIEPLGHIIINIYIYVHSSPIYIHIRAYIKIYNHGQNIPYMPHNTWSIMRTDINIIVFYKYILYIYIIYQCRYVPPDILYIYIHNIPIPICARIFIAYIYTSYPCPDMARNSITIPFAEWVKKPLAQPLNWTLIKRPGHIYGRGNIHRWIWILKII